MANEHAYKQGQSDAANGQGAQRNFGSWQERESYNAGYNNNRK